MLNALGLRFFFMLVLHALHYVDRKERERTEENGTVHVINQNKTEEFT